MSSTKSQGLFPFQHCKILHLVRHAEGFHNAAAEKNFDEYFSPKYLDAQLTPLGWQQVDNLRKRTCACGISKRIDLVIASPLLRTLQTAVGVFGGEGYANGMDAPPLMEAKAGNSDRAAISSLNCPPFISVELCREQWGLYPCDKRRNISYYKLLFPAVDFSLIDNDEDVFWKEDVQETGEEVSARGLEFMKWLWTREEKEIAIVSHSEFWFHTLSAFGNECHPLMKKDFCELFANCELRSMVIFDKSMTGLDSSMTDHPGNVPPGLGLPSVVDEKKQEKEVLNSKPTQEKKLIHLYHYV